jgi:hypothetical protein
MERFTCKDLIRDEKEVTAQLVLECLSRQYPKIDYSKFDYYIVDDYVIDQSVTDDFVVFKILCFANEKLRYDFCYQYLHSPYKKGFLYTHDHCEIPGYCFMLTADRDQHSAENNRKMQQRLVKAMSWFIDEVAERE